MFNYIKIPRNRRGEALFQGSFGATKSGTRVPLHTSGDIIPGIKIKVEVSKIVTTTGIKNSRNGLDHIKAQGFPFTGIKLGVVRISEIVTTTGIINST